MGSTSLGPLGGLRVSDGAGGGVELTVSSGGVNPIRRGSAKGVGRKFTVPLFTSAMFRSRSASILLLLVEDIDTEGTPNKSRFLFSK